MTESASLSRVVIYLMKQVLYRDKQPELWNLLLNLQPAAIEYIQVLGLELLIDASEGYAFLRQMILPEDEEQNFPRLIQRRQLSYSVSLLCVLLRKKLIENDTAGSETRVILSEQQIIDMMKIYLPEQANEVKTSEQIEAGIKKMIDFGFLRPLKNNSQHYEVQRIIKALIDANWLANLEHRIKEYQDYAQSNAD